jgi:hypothetical protein
MHNIHKLNIIQFEGTLPAARCCTLSLPAKPKNSAKNFFRNERKPI